ncbi:MAG: formylglycine-generating enzyme family protein [Leptospiraceae bacterium]|nr:formylglycine-generating enzyme family protein [Leptospiraceae bacterium]
MIFIKGGKFKPLFFDKSKREQVIVESFYIDKYPVSNLEYMNFIKEESKWSLENAKSIFVEKAYLSHWKGNTPDKSIHNAAVVNVSWFAARAYCHWKGKRLPSTAEWEFVALADETQRDASYKKDYSARILKWYSRPGGVNRSEVGSTYKNFYGVYDMHGLIWEWVEDFSTAMVTGDSRGDSSLDKGLFCGSGSLGASNFNDYAAFMRYGFRSSLDAKYTVNNLGFRCAYNN